MEQLQLFDEDFEIGQFVDKLMRKELKLCGVNYYNRRILVKFVKDQKERYDPWTLYVDNTGQISSKKVRED